MGDALPHSPFTRVLGFEPLPAELGALVAGFVALYAAGSEASKRIATRRVPL